MTLAVLIPYRPDTPQRERIQATTSRLWAHTGLQVVYADDGLTGPLFSFSRAVNRARREVDADCLLVYNCDALPLPIESLQRIGDELAAGLPWTAIFDGQQRFTEQQTERLLVGEKPEDVGPAAGSIAMGREALIGIRADVFDGLRGYDERFVGWGWEDLAFHLVLRTVHPGGCDVPTEGLFQSLWHPEAPRHAWPANGQIWASYQPHTFNADKLRGFYLDRP